MLRTPRALAKVQKRVQQQKSLLRPEAAAAGQAPQHRGTQAAAITLALDAIPKGPDGKPEGGRYLIIGASGKGKTHLAIKLVRELVRRNLCKTTVVLDLKDPERPQYEGAITHSVDEARVILAEESPEFLICRAGINGEEAATLVKDSAEARTKMYFFGDELTPLLKAKDDGEPIAQSFLGPSLVWLQLQGRGLGAGSVILVNLVKNVPGSALDNCTAYIVFGTGGRSLNSLIDYSIIPRHAIPIVSKLPRGECGVFFTEEDWNGVIYGPG